MHEGRHTFTISLAPASTFILFEANYPHISPHLHSNTLNSFSASQEVIENITFQWAQYLKFLPDLLQNIYDSEKHIASSDYHDEPQANVPKK